EFLEGEPLTKIVEGGKSVPVPRLVAVARQLAEGLAAAHTAGIVHRDLKPNNVFRSENEPGKAIWKILDFGVAAIAGEGSDLTRGGAVGTPSYMSPEQARGEQVDHRTDVFALGAIAYRVLTGQPAFTAGVAASILYQVVHMQPPQPSVLASLHPDVDRVLALGLAKDKARRLESAAAFALAFRAALRGELSPPLRQAADALLATDPWANPTTV
ncbi:MAG: serine/threonine protein kinase, partial [Deltaproteobacteria bacterium]|nr:serine/threonine protein kinase [Deltaproteobacteria bacterium]